MEHTSRPLTKRPRASLACNACRQTKSKCDGNRPTCERCAKCNAECVYTQSGRDKRMDRQEERKANMALRSRVKELEAQLAAAGLGPQSADAPSSAYSHMQPLDRDKSPGQTSHGGFSDVGSKATAQTPESTADAIATGLFDHPPVVDIGYFGSSSNHAFFWSLSASIENVSHRSTVRYQEPSRQGQATEADEASRAPPLPMMPPSAYRNLQPDDDSFPGRALAVEWTTRFFDTVGAVLPYVSESQVLREIDVIDARDQGWQMSQRSAQALLSIIFAQALQTLDDRSPEPYYRRALGLLDEKTLYIPTVDSRKPLFSLQRECGCSWNTVQALLLLASFQQNTQRSMESWVPHYLAVRVAYQLGIHAPASYEYLAVQDKEIRARLWFAVVNQDRIMTAGLARPALIPLQNVRMDLLELLDPARPSRTTDGSCSRESLIYFRHLTALHEILGVTVDSLYSSNISSSHRLALGDLVARTIDLSWKLEQWREGIAPPGIITSNADFSVFSAAAMDQERYTILLSIFHYRAMMLIHGSLLMRVLERITSTGETASSGVLQDAALSLLKNYLWALREWLQLVTSLLQHRRVFLNCNAVWWTCNYMMLSTSIHSFAFWLLAANLRFSIGTIGIATPDAEAMLRTSLDTLRALGGTSIMSRKAHRCLHRYLNFLKNIAFGVDDQIHDPAPTAATVPEGIEWSQPTPGGANGLPQEFRPEVISSCIDEMFGAVGQDDFMGTGFLTMGQHEGISDFDAAGFI
ncbi:hypothetical protein PLICBS_006235 [Purpureocillium lilacinum]|uniref:uncharacterized protein n=1 Tax=Purpureocillium lilacinum TaxID=33203 RepID=UPI002081EE4F|nr:hypothetical protein PLICBS_006235 [Purpureocillium lilacinum]